MYLLTEGTMEYTVVSSKPNEGGNLRIAALRPGDCRLEIELCPIEINGTVTCEIKERENGAVAFSAEVAAEENRIEISRLYNYVEYSLVLRLAGDGIAEECTPRLFRCGYIPGHVVTYMHPEDSFYRPSGRFLGSPSLIRLPGGKLLASHDVFNDFTATGGTLDTSYFYSSTDEGATWTFASMLPRAFWGKLFELRGRLFFLCVSNEYGALLVYESKDEGKTWLGPTELMAPGTLSEGGPHRAPAPMIGYKGRLWASLEYGSWQSGKAHMAGVISVGADDDPMDAASWVCTGFLPYNYNWPGTSIGSKCEKYLEGNMVVSPEDRLFDFLRYQCRNATPSHGKAILLEVDPQEPATLPRFFRVVDFPGNASKFSIQYDPVMRLYYALCNRIVTDCTHQRNLLSLVSSSDLMEWKLERDIINYNDNGWPEDEEMVGFQYPDWIFDGDDILFLARTALNKAVRYHDANYMTFHRIRNFRR